MTEATHTSGQYFGLSSPIGSSRKMFCGLLQVDDGETVDTGLDTIEAIVFQANEDVAAGWHICCAASVSGGIATTSVGDVDAYAAGAGNSFWCMAVGSKR